MKVQASAPSQLALNSLELKAAELIAHGQETHAIYLLDDQLEYDSSRASIAAMLARSAGRTAYAATFNKIDVFFKNGFPDAYRRGHLPGSIELKKSMQKAAQIAQPPTSYKASQKNAIDDSSKKRN